MITWQDIDTVLLDMDGTLLDLHFDNEFWLRVVPQYYAKLHTISLDEAMAYLMPLMESQRGQLTWYCLDFWSERLGFSISLLKETISHKIAYRPFAKDWLIWLGEQGIQRVLVTNAHPDALSLKLRHTGLEQYLDHVYSSHAFGYPKESQLFWESFHLACPFSFERTAFFDDSESVLNAAKKFGVQHVYNIAQPDMQQAIRDKADSSHPLIQTFKTIM